MSMSMNFFRPSPYFDPHEVRDELNSFARERHIPTYEAAVKQILVEYLLGSSGKNRFPDPEQIIVSGPCTIVIWKDKTKTIVRCSDSETFDVYAAFCAALAKKLYGTNSEIKRKIRKAIREEKKCQKK